VRKLDTTKEALAYVRNLEAKPFKQVMNKILSLLNDPTPGDLSSLKGYADLFRVYIGEHRIVYHFNNESV